MINISGFNEINKKLKDFEKRMKELDGNQVPVNKLLSPAFVSKHTRFANADEMSDSSGFGIETQEDFEAIPDDKWDEFISSVSNFPDWQSMLNKAGEEWMARQLGF